jgi:hypothetical protein
VCDLRVLQLFAVSRGGAMRTATDAFELALCGASSHARTHAHTVFVSIAYSNSETAWRTGKVTLAKEYNNSIKPKSSHTVVEIQLSKELATTC